jgi:hypothetical protein
MTPKEFPAKSNIDKISLSIASIMTDRTVRYDVLGDDGTLTNEWEFRGDGEIGDYGEFGNDDRLGDYGGGNAGSPVFTPRRLKMNLKDTNVSLIGVIAVPADDQSHQTILLRGLGAQLNK